MNRQEKIEFIEGITNLLQETMIKNVDKMPEEWDGTELRQYLVDCANDNFNWKPMMGNRKRDYKNTLVINNL